MTSQRLSGSHPSLAVLAGISIILLLNVFWVELELHQTLQVWAVQDISSYNRMFRRPIRRSISINHAMGYRNMRTDAGTLVAATNSIIDIVVGSGAGITTPDAQTTDVIPNSKVGSILIEIFGWTYSIDGNQVIDASMMGYYVIFNPQNQIPIANYPAAFGFVGSNIAGSQNKRAILDWGTVQSRNIGRGDSAPSKVLRVRLPVERVRIGDHLQLVMGRTAATPGTSQYLVNFQYYYTPP